MKKVRGEKRRENEKNYHKMKTNIIGSRPKTISFGHSFIYIFLVIKILCIVITYIFASIKPAHRDWICDLVVGVSSLA